MLNDAAGRRLMLADDPGMVAGHDEKGFFVGSDDQRFVLRPAVLFKFRNTTNYTESGKPNGDDAIQNGFEIRQMPGGRLGGPRRRVCGL